MKCEICKADMMPVNEKKEEDAFQAHWCPYCGTLITVDGSGDVVVYTCEN